MRSTPHSQAIQAALEASLDENEFSGVIHLSRRGELLYERARGLADRAHLVANTVETQFGIASVTKGFTALAVMSLVAEGSLCLDTKVRSLLGDQLPLIDPAVTVGHLLAHTSGIGDYLDESLIGDIGDYVMPVPVHRLARAADFIPILSIHPMKSAVGERFVYNNSGYMVLALVVEAVTGDDYFDAVARRVLNPAGMNATAFLRSDQLPGSAAIGYLPAGDGWRTNHFHLPIRGSGDGGAYSTVGDFAAFWPALFAGAIVPRPLVEEMVRPHNEVPDGLSYGLGFWLRPDRNTVMLEGYDAGVSCRSACDRVTGLTYTVISNTSNGAWPVVRRLEELLLEMGDGAGGC
ncbi:MAG: serine hydrolase [Candidatus Eisenbacteria bacterium]|nr:serine hydrolase [Candidatus Eisenbacteria bacterium]